MKRGSCNILLWSNLNWNRFIHTQWSWWFKQSDWFAITDYSTIFTSQRVDNVWARCFCHFSRERSFKSQQNPRVDLFLRRKRLGRIQNGFSIYCSWILCSMNCLQLPFLFIRVEEAVSWTQRFSNKKIWPKIRSLSTTKKFESKCLQKFYVSSKEL